MHVSLTISPIRDSADRLVGAATIGRDISDRKQAEEALEESREKLRYLTSQLMTAQEAERRRISLDLHDGMGQSLTYLKLTLRRLMNSLPPEMEEHRRESQDLLDFINSTIEDIRRLCRQLVPYLLEDLGLVAALENLAREFERLNAAKVSLSLDKDINRLFRPESQTAIYRIFQEAFNNIAKHAQATEVAMVIRRSGNRINFQIEDNGIGLDKTADQFAVNPDRGMGLSAMEERVRMLGGNLQVRSQPGHGTKIYFSLSAQEASPG
jgi:signal transduction histidine kinase